MKAAAGFGGEIPNQTIKRFKSPSQSKASTEQAIVINHFCQFTHYSKVLLNE